METFQKEYLGHIGMEEDYSSEFIPCEVCGNTTFTVIREIIDIGRKKYGKFPVIACNTCGFLCQNPRFNKQFYNDYYNKFYREVVYGDEEPFKEFVDGQVKRAEELLKNIKKYFDRPGRMLDVGCAVGAMLIPFIRDGWKAFGIDPGLGYINYGKNKMGLPVACVNAEEMHLGNDKYDFIMIIGSLEHVYDPNLTLSVCRKASGVNALLLLMARGRPLGSSKDYFNHNHLRYFTFNSLELIMMKHGWSPILTTDEPWTGIKERGYIFCLGRVSEPPDNKTFLNIINSGKREDPKDILKKFDEIDKK